MVRGPYYFRNLKRDPDFENCPYPRKGFNKTSHGMSRVVVCCIWEFPKIGDPNIVP